MKKTTIKKILATGTCSALATMSMTCGISTVFAQTTTNDFKILGKGIASHQLYLNEGNSPTPERERQVLTVNNGNANTVQWSSSDENIVKIDSTGYITTVNQGTATITATSGENSDYVQVTVQQKKEQHADSFAVRRNGVHYINLLSTQNIEDGGFSTGDYLYTYGSAATHSDDTVYMGDWDGDGIDTPAIRNKDGIFMVSNSRTGGSASIKFMYGSKTDASENFVVGDWNGDGKDTFAVRRGDVLYVRNELSAGAADVQMKLISSEGRVIAGDWDGDGLATPTILYVKQGVLHISLSNTPIGARANETNEAPDDIKKSTLEQANNCKNVLVGDWEGNGKDSLALHKNNGVLEMKTNGYGTRFKTITFGNADETLYAGYWGDDIPANAKPLK